MGVCAPGRLVDEKALLSALMAVPMRIATDEGGHLRFVDVILQYFKTAHVEVSQRVDQDHERRRVSLRSYMPSGK